MKLAAFLTISYQSAEAFDKKRMLPGNLLREAREQLQLFDPIPVESFAAKPQGNLKMPRGDFTVETATRLCKKNFGEDAYSEYLAEGAQGMVYKCLNDVTGTAVAQKMYKNPYFIDTERARVVEQAMSDTGNGPQIYGFEEYKPALIDEVECCDLSACDPYVEGCADCSSCPQDAYFCKFEELLYGKSLDKFDDLEANQPEIYRVAAKLFAKLHIVTQKDVPRKMNYCYVSWPWNTRAMAAALGNWGKGTTDFVTKLIEEHPIVEGSVKITNIDEYMAFLYDLAYASISPGVWAHNDLHPGNFYVRDADEGTPMEERLMFIDYDNSEFGQRSFDLTYYMLNTDFSDVEVYDDFIRAYAQEYSAVGPRELTVEQLDQEIVCNFPWAFMNKVYLFATYGAENFAKLFYIGFQEWAKEYGKGNVSCPWEGRYPEYPKCYPIA